MKKSPLLRPEIRDRAVFALQKLAHDRNDAVYSMTPTALVNYLILEEWQRRYPGMMFPDENGKIMPLPCTLPPVNT